MCPWDSNPQRTGGSSRCQQEVEVSFVKSWPTPTWTINPRFRPRRGRGPPTAPTPRYSRSLSALRFVLVALLFLILGTDLLWVFPLVFCRCGSRTGGPNGGRRKSAGAGRPSWPSMGCTGLWWGIRCLCPKLYWRVQKKMRLSLRGCWVIILIFVNYLHRLFWSNEMMFSPNWKLELF